MTDREPFAWPCVRSLTTRREPDLGSAKTEAEALAVFAKAGLETQGRTLALVTVAVAGETLRHPSGCPLKIWVLWTQEQLFAAAGQGGMS